IQSLDRFAIHPEGRFAEADPQQIDALAAPFLRDPGLAAKPVRRPERPELHSDLRRLPLLQLLRIGVSDAIRSLADLKIFNGNVLGIDFRSHPLGKLADALARVLRMTLHSG